jgi:glycosyltransferase involved in cell wall biosynthesis
MSIFVDPSPPRGPDTAMRFLLACEFYHPSVGGVQVVMRQIAERLVASGHEVVVATSALPDRDFDTLNGVRIESFAVSGNAVNGMVGEVERYRDFVRNFRGDALLVKAAQQWTCDALWPVLDRIAMRKVFIPCGFSGLHWPAYAGYFEGLKTDLKKWDHLIFYAEDYRDVNFAREIGVSDFSIVPNGASEVEFDAEIPDPAIRAKLGIPEDAFVFLTVGSLTGVKGHREIMEAFARLETAGRPAVLVLNGNAPPAPVPIASADGSAAAEPFRKKLKRWRRAVKASLRAAARRLAWRLGLRATPEATPPADPIAHWKTVAEAQPGKRVMIVDLERPDLVSLFRRSDLFVFASNIEYSPLVLYEAAAAGLPFVTVPVGNAVEIAAWTGAGVLCPAPVDATGFTRVDPSVLSKAMTTLMADPDGLAALGATGRERWSRYFTWQRIAERYEAILAGHTASGEEFRRDVADVRVV